MAGGTGLAKESEQGRAASPHQQLFPQHCPDLFQKQRKPHGTWWHCWIFFHEFCEKFRLCHLSLVQRDWQEELRVVPHGLVTQTSSFGIWSAEYWVQSTGLWNVGMTVIALFLLQRYVHIKIKSRYYRCVGLMSFIPWDAWEPGVWGILRICLDGIYFHTRLSGVKARVVS